MSDSFDALHAEHIRIHRAIDEVVRRIIQNDDRREAWNRLGDLLHRASHVGKRIDSRRLRA